MWLPFGGPEGEREAIRSVSTLEVMSRGPQRPAGFLQDSQNGVRDPARAAVQAPVTDQSHAKPRAQAQREEVGVPAALTEARDPQGEYIGVSGHSYGDAVSSRQMIPHGESFHTREERRMVQDSLAVVAQSGEARAEPLGGASGNRRQRGVEAG